MSAEPNETSTAPQRRRLTRTGFVISDAMEKTIIVAVERMVQHDRYKRVVRRTTKFYAHDEKNVCSKGDLVTIVETRPMSSLKRWRLRKVVLKAPAAATAPAIKDAPEDKGRPMHKRRPEDRKSAPEGGDEAAS
jgi:small subunit ribosomal protein S17